MDNLSNLLQTQIRNKKFHIFKLGGVDSIPNLLFADDVFIFGQVDLSTILATKQALDEFSLFSRMKVNNEKSIMVFSKSFSQRLQSRLEVVNNVPIKEFPIKYLGLPLTAGKLKHQDCRGLVDSLEKCLSMWEGSTPMCGGVNYYHGSLVGK